jgi:hypothetical protein
MTVFTNRGKTRTASQITGVRHAAVAGACFVFVSVRFPSNPARDGPEWR